MDRLDKQQRSLMMAGVRTKNTTPELAVRSVLHASGYRYRLNVKNLPGTPDIVLAKHSSVIFVHGCFWHQHPNCRKATLPQQNAEFWRDKLAGNVERDERKQNELHNQGWRVFTIWECETRDRKALSTKLNEWLKGCTL